MFLEMLPSPTELLIIGLVSIVYLWMFWEIVAAPKIPPEKEDDVCTPDAQSHEEGILRNLDDYETIFTWKPRHEKKP